MARLINPKFHKDRVKASRKIMLAKKALVGRNMVVLVKEPFNKDLVVETREALGDFIRASRDMSISIQTLDNLKLDS